MASVVILLLEGKGLEDERVPLVWEGMEDGGNGGRGGRSRGHGLVSVCEGEVKREDGLGLTARRSDSSSFSPVRGSLLSLMYLRMRRWTRQGPAEVHRGGTKNMTRSSSPSFKTHECFVDSCLYRIIILETPLSSTRPSVTAPLETTTRKASRSPIRSFLALSPAIPPTQPSFIVECIGDGKAFGVDSSDQAQSDKFSIKPAKLQTIFDSPASASAHPKAPSADDKKKVEKLKVWVTRESTVYLVRPCPPVRRGKTDHGGTMMHSS